MSVRERFPATVFVWRWLSTTKSVRIFVLCAVGLPAIALAAIQIEQMLFRRNAEELVSAVRNLQFGKATYNEVQGVLRHWAQASQTKGDCSKRCSSEIVLENFAGKHGPFLAEHKQLTYLYWHVGARPGSLQVRFEFEKGILQSGSVFVDVNVMNDHDYAEGPAGYSLLGEVGFLSKTNSDPYRFINSRLHPTYSVGKPGGCEGCLMVWAMFLPEASRPDIDRLAQFDLSCMTRRLHPCRFQNDIMPAAWQPHLDDQAQEK